MPTYYNENGIRIEMRIREQGHNVPHVHVYYQGQERSLSLKGKVLAGTVKGMAKRLAIRWVLENNEMLTEEWRKYHV